jgi:ArsR family transcriptional regulator
MPGKQTSLSDFLSALADPTRLRLLALLQGQELCVCFLVEVLRQPQAKVSRHLARLRRTGLVDARREGKWMHYRLRTQEDNRANILAAALAAHEGQAVARHDKDRLMRTCDRPERYAALQGAPLPQRISCC